MAASAIYHLFTEHELLLLCIITMAGLCLGRLEVRGVRLGSAGVLFAGLGLGAALSPSIGPATAQLKELGLVLFVYCVGLTSAPGLFAAWKQGGLKLNALVFGALASTALVAVIGGRLLGFDRGLIAGIFCGALTNTPALGAAADRLAGTPLSLAPVLGYSVTYPLGVLGALVSFRVFESIRRRQLGQEVERHAASQAKIASVNLVVTAPEVIGRSLGELRLRQAAGVVVSRLCRDGAVIVPNQATVLGHGDVITIVGDESVIAQAIRLLGERSSQHLETQRDVIDARRILVSRASLVGCTIGALELERKFNARVTRVRRADVDIVATDELRLQRGDRLRVVAPVERLAEVGRFFGDSERELAEIDYVALACGLSAGLLVARVPLPIAGTSLSLGSAGGPLIVALILGRLGRTGRLVWSMPYEANQVLRELGLLLFLAGVGVSAGSHLGDVSSLQGLTMLAFGAFVTLLASALVLWLAHARGHASVTSSLGAAAGMQTQPATLSAAFEICGRSEETYVAYALVYPTAMVGKILIAQLIVMMA